jgi:hypothetical protein
MPVASVTFDGPRPQAARRPALLRAGLWASLLTLLLVLGWAAWNSVWPADVARRASRVAAVVGLGGAELGWARLTREGNQWFGDASAFPPGSLAHFQPEGSPGFFLVHAPHGQFVAVTERSAHPTGGRLTWREPLYRADYCCVPSEWNAGFVDRHTFYDWSGTPEAGPGPWPGHHRVVREGERLSIERYAVCPLPEPSRTGHCWPRSQDSPPAP